MKIDFRTVFLALLLAASALVVAGCETSDPDNLSSMPWNQPKDWEGAMPSSINNGR